MLYLDGERKLSRGPAASRSSHKILSALIAALCWLVIARPACAQISSIPQSLSLNFENPGALWSRMPPNQQRAVGEGATVGALAGTFIAAYPALSQGAGGGNGGNSLAWVGAGMLMGSIVGGALGYLAEQRWPSAPAPSSCSEGSLLNPCPGQFDIQIGNMSGFTGPGSIVRVREFATEGTGLHFPAMGINTEQIPGLDLTYWVNEVSGVHFQLRYFDVTGSRFLGGPAYFNGKLLAPQELNAENFPWFDGGLYYVRRLTPLYQRYEDGWPGWLRGWDLRAEAGITYTYVNWQFNGGHALMLEGKPPRTVVGGDTQEDFYHQDFPAPALGLQAFRSLGGGLTFESSVKGYWFNRWNSLRSEGGTVWASQNGLEAHARIFYSNPRWFGPVRPMLGFFYYYYSQLEDSHEDGNFLRWSAYGPEVGINVSF